MKTLTRLIIKEWAMAYQAAQTNTTLLLAHEHSTMSALCSAKMGVFMAAERLLEGIVDDDEPAELVWYREAKVNCTFNVSIEPSTHEERFRQEDFKIAQLRLMQPGIII